MKAPRSICRGRVDGKIKEGSDSAGSNRVFGDTDRPGFHFPSGIRRKPEKFPVPGTIRDWKPLEFPEKFRQTLKIFKKFV